jgi:hypothetical protein
MKVYVQGYRTQTDAEMAEAARERRPFDPVENFLVAYTGHPDWKIPAIHEAEFQCDELRRANVHVGSHYCEFSLEKLPDADFVIVCLTHPELRSAQYRAAQQHPAITRRAPFGPPPPPTHGTAQH